MTTTFPGITLSHCPFCGKKAVFELAENQFNDVMVRCDSCGSAGPVFDDEAFSDIPHHATAPQINATAAAKHWNSRYTKPVEGY
jgi:hypothetical protein